MRLAGEEKRASVSMGAGRVGIRGEKEKPTKVPKGARITMGVSSGGIGALRETMITCLLLVDQEILRIKRDEKVRYWSR
jgi:hypothetical protein